MWYECIDVLMYWYQRLVRCRCSESIHPSVVLERIIAPLVQYLQKLRFLWESKRLFYYLVQFWRGGVTKIQFYLLPLYTNRLAVGTVGCGETIICAAVVRPLHCLLLLYDDVDVLSVGCNKTFHVPVLPHVLITFERVTSWKVVIIYSIFTYSISSNTFNAT